MKVSFKINGKKSAVEVPVNRTLSDVLRTQGFWSIKHGCEKGSCGNCVILFNGQAVNSCIQLTAQAEGAEIETYEKYEKSTEYKLLQEVLMDYVDIECAYCVPGMFLSLKALLDKIPDPTEEEIVDALAGHICRCIRDPLPVHQIYDAIKKVRGKF